jgi:uncharacterized membrane protein
LEQHINELSTGERQSHKDPPLINVNQVLADTLTPGQRSADSLAILMGSWTFIIVQSVLLAIWDRSRRLRLDAFTGDPYTFILLNSSRLSK